jgi:hypothetical protein
MKNQTMRTCNVCGESKALTEYYVNNKGNLHGKCKKCYVKKQQETYDPVKKRNENLKRCYGITLDEYNNLLNNQNGKCATCGTTKPGGRKSGRGGGTNVFVVDHCHNTGAVRGLLCHSCNRAMGLLGDNTHIIEEMIKYLQKHQ